MKKGAFDLAVILSPVAVIWGLACLIQANRTVGLIVLGVVAAALVVAGFVVWKTLLAFGDIVARNVPHPHDPL